MSPSQRTEHGVEFVKLDLIDLQLAQKVARKGVELLGRFYQCEIGIFYLMMAAAIIRCEKVHGLPFRATRVRRCYAATGPNTGK